MPPKYKPKSKYSKKTFKKEVFTDSTPERDHLGHIMPGHCLNAKGRPKGSKNKYSIKELMEAIKEVEVEKGESLLSTFVKKGYEDKTVMIALMKKLLPDLKSIEGVMANFEASMEDEVAKAIQEELLERYK